MFELSRHIESLVLRHNCVIVPGLGGFVAQYVPARRVEGENLFLPACRSVGFNPQLTLNDGLLVQSYMQAYDTSFPETVRIIEEEVAQLRETIRREGSCDIKGIGRLSLNAGGGYDFSPNEAGVVSPELYGLDSFVLEKRVEAKDGKKPAKRKKARTPIVKRSEKAYTFSLNREAVNYAAAIVAAVVFYFLWATPAAVVVPAAGDGTQTAALAPVRLLTAPVAAPAAGRKATPPVSPSAENARTERLEKVSAPVPDKPSENTREQKVREESGYALVLASAIGRRNAETFAAQLRTEGEKDARVYKRGKMTRVVCGCYDTREAAQAALHGKQGNARFAEAWVIRLK